MSSSQNNSPDSVSVSVEGTDQERQLIAQRYQTVYEQGPLGIVIVEQDLRIRHANARFCEMLGYTEKELQERTIPDITHPEDLENDLANARQLLQQELSFFSMEKRYLTKSGESLWCSLSATVIHEDKEFYAIGMVLDISEHKKAEAALLESEARFRTVADNAPVFIWMSDTEGNCHWFNQPWLEFTGRTMEQEVREGWVERLHPEDRPHCLETYYQALSQRQPFRLEYRLSRHDGQYRTLLDTGTPRYDKEGKFLGYIGSCIDITEQKAMQEQLFETQKLESLGRLAGGIAHDFNNLLTAILGYTDMALSDISGESELAQFLTNAHTAAERAAALTAQLLTYARRQAVTFQNVQLNTICLDLDPLLRRTIGEQYELITLLEETAGIVYANVTQIEQVLMNLVVNARDAMPNGGRIVIETRNVTLDAAYTAAHVDVTPGEYVLLSVSDNGVGMTPEVQERVFEPFFTTKEFGKGTGLGLASCYGIVKQSSGNIWVYSEPGKGSTFKVYLPRVSRANEISPGKQEKPVPVSGGETILLVDDEPMVRDIAARLLRFQGYRVLEAGTGADALSLQASHGEEIDLLLTDIVMPLMSGCELSERLSALHPRMQTLYMSGYTQNVILQQGILQSEMHMISKPFSGAELTAAVVEVLNARKSRN